MFHFSTRFFFFWGGRGSESSCTLERLKLKFLKVFKLVGKNKKKMKKKQEFLRKPIFLTKSFCLCKSKNNSRRYIQFLPNVYFYFFYVLYNFKIMLTLFDLSIGMNNFRILLVFIIIDDKKCFCQSKKLNI